MRNKLKKLTGMTAILALCFTAVSFAGCGNGSYSTSLPKADISGEVKSNGGFLAEKGNYIYFINGAESYTASNKYGDVTKGALLRISKTDLKAGNYEKTDVVVPMLFVAQNYDAGIYIYGDYVYYATPATEKDLNGDVQNSYLNFKRAKLDGSEAMKDYYFRSDDNSVQYRYVEVDDVVYCLHSDDKTLYSYNTATGKDTVLVKDAASDFFFDQTDATGATVYYTMEVTQDVDTENSSKVKYTQLYSVRADASVSSVDAKNASYTVKDGRTYSYNAAYMNKQDGFDAEDYTTYPYVNLGKLVFDGVGKNDAYKQTPCNDPAEEGKAFNADAATPNGYTYTIQRQENGGIYFTRTALDATSSSGENAKLYYLASADVTAGWNAVTGNQSEKIATVALNTDNASSSAVFAIEDGTHYYYYISDSKIYKTKANADGTEAESILMAASVSSATLWKIEGEYLYYYSDGSNGSNLSRIKYDGDRDDYKALYVEKEYQPAKILSVDWNKSWYKPEFVDNYLFYSNAEAFGSTSYNYIYVVNLNGANGMMDAEELDAFNEKYEEVTDFIDETSDSDLKNALSYIFRSGDGETDNYFEKILAKAKEKGYNDYHLYSDAAIKEFRAFAAHAKSENILGTDYSVKFKDGDEYYDRASYYMNLVGKMKSSDEEAIEKVWETENIKTLSETSSEKGLSTKAKVWIGVGVGAGVLVLAGAAFVIVYFVKKKKKEEADRAATAIRVKPVIDTTDDKSIDVYAVDGEENATENGAETAVETATEDTAEEATETAAEEENAEAVTEETTDETTEETTAENSEEKNNSEE